MNCQLFIQDNISSTILIFMFLVRQILQMQ